MSTRILRALLFLISMLLISACDTENQIAEGGMGGTGITMGRIKALGSVVVNGVKYNTTEANFIRDGVSVTTQDDFLVGEIVTVEGTVNEDGITGNAYSVVFSDILEGPVTVKPALRASSLQVMGQTVHINDLTILHDFQILNDLNPNDIVEVSGFIDADANINASSITLKTVKVNQFEIKGIISQLDQDKKTFKLGNLLVDFTNAKLISIESLSDVQDRGQRVQVFAAELTDLVLSASRIDLLRATELAPETKVEVEGLITRFSSINDFDLNNLPVITTSHTLFKDGISNELAPNVLIELEGVVNEDSVLVADSISLLKAERLAALEANIDSIDKANKTLVILGNTIQANAETVFYDESAKRSTFFSFEELVTGEYVDIKVSSQQKNGFLVALRLSREDQEPSISFKGTVASIDVQAGTLGLFNLNMITDSNTLYMNKDKQFVDKTTFFSLLKLGATFVAVEGDLAGSRTVLLESARIIDIN